MFRICIYILFLIFNLNATDKYFVTAADAKYFNYLLNLIGSIHETNFVDTKKIAVFNLGLEPDQILKLNRIQKVQIYEIEKTHPDILKPIVERSFVPGRYAWKPVAIKQALDKFPYILWIDAGTTILKPLDVLFTHIKEEGYFLATIGDEKENNKFKHDINWHTTEFLKQKFNLYTSEKNWILSQETLLSGVIGISKKAKNLFIMPMYELTHDLRNYNDDGSCSGGFGAARYDQTLLSILAYLKKLTIHIQDATQENPMYIIDEDNDVVPFYITWIKKYVDEKTHIFSSRGALNLEHYLNKIRYKIA